MNPILLAKNNVTFYALFCMQFTLDKNPGKIFLFTTRLLLLDIPCRKSTNSAGNGARQSGTDSAQLVRGVISI